MLPFFRNKLHEHLHIRIRDAETESKFAQSPALKEYWEGKVTAYKEVQEICKGTWEI